MTGRRDERGQSVTVFFAVVVVALLLVCGLVVDGGRQATATREAQAVAAAAARAATDAATGALLAGGDGYQPGLEAGRRLLAGSGMQGTVTPLTGGVRVETSTSVPTVFLSLVGITSLPARGSATAEYRVVR